MKKKEYRFPKLTTLLFFSLLFSLSIFAQTYQRVILDTDANNELDDQHAIAYLLFNQDIFKIEGITTNKTYNGGSINNHTAEAERVVKMCNSSGQFPILSGADGDYNSIKPFLSNSDFDGSDAVNFIVQKAHETPAGKKLLLLSVGKITNIALALEKDSAIIPKVKIIFLGTQIPNSKGEYNQDNDKAAVNAVLDTDVEIWIVPADVSCDALSISKKQINRDMPEKGTKATPAIQGRDGKYYSNFGDYSVTLYSNVPDEWRCIYDVVAISTAKNPKVGKKNIVYGPYLNDDGTWLFNGGTRQVVYFNRYDSEAVQSDFWETMNNPVLGSNKTSPSNPVKIIFDCDFGDDGDDLVALCMLHKMQDNKECEIIAIGQCNSTPKALPAIDIINTYYGRPDIPLGQQQSNTHKGDQYITFLTDNYPELTDLESSYSPNVVSIYRKALSETPDKSVKFIVVGLKKNMADLLKSGADEYSSLTGIELVAKKVIGVYDMGGIFPSGKEFNYQLEPASTKYYVENWPTPMFFAGNRWGEMLVGGTLRNMDTPPGRALDYKIAGNGGLYWGVKPVETAQAGFDCALVFAAVRGAEKYFSLVSGYNYIYSNGSNYFEKVSGYNHTYTSGPAEEKSYKSMADEIGEMVIEKPQ